jgi:hypothetical protein
MYKPTYEQQIDACKAAISDAYYEANPYTVEQRERLHAAMDTIRRHKELMVWLALLVHAKIVWDTPTLANAWQGVMDVYNKEPL